ncbi:isocitrate/isopropylmalate family dehydrogenase [Acaryochloris marina]|uniref:isocitrate/isopropylmalate family dehydrogenase n=1 Tax=Acaryochloris marina TaxID=155978 RepID=UPI0021C2DC42|nr:isocitrate/isopropylmalate family dehydrogenase [Acaryochloris marina]BDM79479.1 isocitrate dehydrogenase [Acaryochloris marina MBIC10699]
MGYPVVLIREGELGAWVTNALQMAIAATGVDINWQIVDMGGEERQGLLPSYIFDLIRTAKTAVIGPLIMPDNYRQMEADIREKLDLYVNLRPTKTMVGIPSNYQNVDLMIVRETTEGIYAGIEFERTSVEAADARSFLSKLSGKRIREDAAVGIKPISVKGCGQIIEFAFNYARKTGRHQVIAVHQAHVMAHTDGLFLEIAQDIAQEFPDIDFEDRSIEVICRELMQKPERFDVLVMPNLYGDLLAHLCAGMVGGLSVPIAHIGDKYAVFGAQSTGTGDVENDPTSLILAGALMLRHLGEQEAAQRLQTAVEAVVADQVDRAADLNPVGFEGYDSQSMAQAITQAIAA